MKRLKMDFALDNVIKLEGVSTNNLKSLQVNFPLGKITVVTGVSGSGKSSLVFDTLYGESYRRYVESLSSFARQYLQSLPKPNVSVVENLPPSIAVQQSRSGAGPRSTVGTLTELNDLFKVLYFRISEVKCFQCDKEVKRDSAESIFEKCIEQAEGKHTLLLSSLDVWKNLKSDELKQQLMKQGFTRLFGNQEIVKIENAKSSNLKNAYVVIDRLKPSYEEKRRFIQSADLALRLGRGQMAISFGNDIDLKFSSKLECVNCQIQYVAPSTALFSFNHPVGACDNCQGYGRSQILDWDKIIDVSSSIKEKGIRPFNFGKHVVFYTKMMNHAVKNGIDPAKKFKEFTKDELHWLCFGDGKRYQGIKGYFSWLETKKYKAHYRIHAARFNKYILCEACHGDRLNKFSLACKIDDKSISDISKISVKRLISWVASLYQTLDDFINMGESVNQKSADLEHLYSRSSNNEKGIMQTDEVLDEIAKRLTYLNRIGLHYLQLDRSSSTLSGGELQRIKLARCLGSSLTDTLFCLDEPTVGLHVRDSMNLLRVLQDIRDQGNTIVVVEHERSIIDAADYLVEIGPEAGHKGGQLVYSGPVKLHSTKLECHAKKYRVASITDSEKLSRNAIIIKNASAHNLKNITAIFPMDSLITVCGVSGSGKTSLIQHSLHPLLLNKFGQENDYDFSDRLDLITPEKFIKRYEQVIMVGQIPLSRSKRSNIATYLGVFDFIRKLFSEQPAARKAGYSPSHFSFNVAGGRCENCQGIGMIEEDLSFLGDMQVICQSCSGCGFKDEVCSIYYKDKNLIDVLNMTVAQCREFFFDIPKVVKVLDEVINLGLGYLTLRQSTSSFSGGEAQRLKLLKLLNQRQDGKPSILIFDEPTSGLSDYDVYNLLSQLRLLVKSGHMVIVVEHHLEVISASDWIVELGPEAGEDGGEIVFQGTADELLKSKKSVIRNYIN
ncbi:MAG: excinuclease ABC subunit UvrA [Bdellovibrionota bacterium]